MFRIFASTFTNVKLLFNPLNQFIMGKVVGLIGSASGKIGNLVYAVTNGIQTARVYQPIVSNPKSTSQMLQRAKGNLAGRLSAITPREAIMGLGKNNRVRRGAYLSNILRNSTATLNEGVYDAKLQPENLVFSRGSAIPVIRVTGATVSALGAVTISYVRPSYATRDAWDAAGGSFVVAAIDSVTGGYDFVQVANWDKPNYPSADVAQQQLVYVESIDQHEIFVYFVPYVINPALGSVQSAGLGVDANAYVASVGLTDAASNLEFGNSKFGGEAVPES